MECAENLIVIIFFSCKQEVNSSVLREKLKNTLEECNDVLSKIVMKLLRQAYDSSVVKQMFFSECSYLITRELKYVLERRPTGEFSMEEQRNIVDSLWRFLQLIATSKESAPDLHTRMTQALLQEYVNSCIWTNIMQDLATEISVEDLLRAKATKCMRNKLGFKNENLTEDQMMTLVSVLGQLVEAVLKRRGEDCFTTGLNFEEGMVSEIKTKFPNTISEYEERLNITLYDGFKMLLQIYTLQKFINLMISLQNMWNLQNKPSEILLQKKDDYITEIEARFKYEFSCVGEGEIVAKKLFKSIELNAFQDARIQVFNYIGLSQATNCEEMSLYYFDTLDKRVAAFTRLLKHLDNRIQSIKSWFANEVDSLDSEESVLATYRSTLKHKLIRVKLEISNSHSKSEIYKIVKEKIKNADDQYYSQIDPKDDDFGAFRSSIVRTLDSFIESEDSN